MNKKKSLDDMILSSLSLLNDKQKRAVMKLIKELAEKKEYDLWEDPEFMAELDRRTADFDKGIIEGLTWTQVKRRARQSVKTKEKPVKARKKLAKAKKK